MNVPKLKDSRKYKDIVSIMYLAQYKCWSPYTLAYKTDNTYAPFWIECYNKGFDVTNHRERVYYLNLRTAELIRYKT